MDERDAGGVVVEQGDGVGDDATVEPTGATSMMGRDGPVIFRRRALNGAANTRRSNVPKMMNPDVTYRPSVPTRPRSVRLPELMSTATSRDVGLPAPSVAMRCLPSGRNDGHERPRPESGPTGAGPPPPAGTVSSRLPDTKAIRSREPQLSEDARQSHTSAGAPPPTGAR